MRMTSRRDEIGAAVFALMPLVIALGTTLLPWFGQRHLPDSIVFPARAGLFIAIAMAGASLYFSACVFRVRGPAILPVVTTLVAGSFLLWALPLACGVLSAIVCGAC